MLQQTGYPDVISWGHVSSDHTLQDPAVTYIDLYRGNAGHQMSYFLSGTENNSNPFVYIVSIMLAIIPLKREDCRWGKI